MERIESFTGHIPSRQEVWLRAYLAAMANPSIESPTVRANICLANYDETFEKKENVYASENL